MTNETAERRLSPDTDLVARMATQDGAALDELRSRHALTAYAVAYGILRDYGRADQAVSEAFLEASAAAHRFVPGELTVLAWLTKLTRQHAEAILAPVR